MKLFAPLFVIINFSILHNYLHASEVANTGYSLTINVQQYSPTTLEMKKSLLRVLIASNWQIIEHSSDTIVARYKMATLEAKIENYTLRLREVPSSAVFTRHWLDTIESYFIKEIIYFYQSHIAEKLASQ